MTGQVHLSQIQSCFDNLTDNSLCQHDEATYGSTKTMAQGDITPFTGGFVTDVYQVAYKGIARVNLVMYQLSQYKGTDISNDDCKSMLGQCKALRGYFYYYCIYVTKRFHWLRSLQQKICINQKLLEQKSMLR